MGVRGEGSGKKGGGKWGQTGREVVVRGREVGNAYPPTPPPPPPCPPPLDLRTGFSAIFVYKIDIFVTSSLHSCAPIFSWKGVNTTRKEFAPFSNTDQPPLSAQSLHSLIRVVYIHQYIRR